MAILVDFLYLTKPKKNVKNKPTLKNLCYEKYF